MSKAVRLILSDSYHASLRVIAAKKGKSMATVMKEIAEKFVEKETQKHERNSLSKNRNLP